MSFIQDWPSAAKAVPMARLNTAAPQAIDLASLMVSPM
jgi:hypothetical protein